MRSLISLSEYTEGAEQPNQSSKIVGVLGHQGGWCINCYIPADWDKKGRGLSAIAKFMLSIREEPFKTISAEARDRGIWVQELLRAVVVPDWVRENIDLSGQPRPLGKLQHG